MKNESPYPYSIPAADRTKIKSKVRPVEAEQFWLIETLLRTPEAMRLYEKDRPGFEQYWRNYHGVFSCDPLSASHHALICNRDKELDQKLRNMGYVDVSLGIYDLGAIAKLPPKTTITHGEITLAGPWFGGESECKLRLKSNNPRDLHLRIDTSHPPAAIWEAIAPLLQERYKRLASGKRRYATEALNKKQIITRMDYFRCFDLQQSGYSRRQIADIISEGRDDSCGGAEDYTKKALQQVRSMIRDARAQISRDKNSPLWVHRK